MLAVVVLTKGGRGRRPRVPRSRPSAIFVGGFTGGAGIALAFAFASFIGFEATAIYGEESRDPKRTVPRATYLAVSAITVLFALTSFAIVTGLGHAAVVDETVKRSTVDGTPLADPARRRLQPWPSSTSAAGCRPLMSWLVLSSLFAGLLAFQNSAARYFFAHGPRRRAADGCSTAPTAAARRTSPPLTRRCSRSS